MSRSQSYGIQSIRKTTHNTFMADCSICLEAYDNPRVLPCGHSFCYRCLNEMWHQSRRANMLAAEQQGAGNHIAEFDPFQSQGSPPTRPARSRLAGENLATISAAAGDSGKVTSILCPTCRKVCYAKPDTLPVNFSTLELIQATRANDSIEDSSGTTVKCQVCSKRKSVTNFPRSKLHWCCQCRMILCPSCVIEIHRDHQTMAYLAFALLENTRFKEQLHTLKNTSIRPVIELGREVKALASLTADLADGLHATATAYLSRLENGTSELLQKSDDGQLFGNVLDMREEQLLSLEKCAQTELKPYLNILKSNLQMTLNILQSRTRITAKSLQKEINNNKDATSDSDESDEEFNEVEYLRLPRNVNSNENG